MEYLCLTKKWEKHPKGFITWFRDEPSFKLLKKEYPELYLMKGKFR